MSMKRLSRDEAFLIAVNIAKLPSVPRQILKDIPRPPNRPAGTIQGNSMSAALPPTTDIRLRRNIGHDGPQADVSSCSNIRC